MLTTKNWGSALVLSTTVLLSVTAFQGCQPAGPRALLQGERLIQEEKFAQAVEKLKLATELLPQNAQAWNHLGLAYYGATQTEEAIHAYEQAIALDRNLAAARFNLGALYLEQNKNAEAVSELTTFTALQSNSTEGWLHLATAHLRLRRFDEAEKAFVRVQKLEPKNPQMLDGLGVIQLQRKRPKEAFSYFESALQQNPKFAPALLNEAIVLQQYLNNRAGALQKYEAYLALKPASPNIEAIQETARRLDAELHPRPVVVNTNLVIAPRTSTQPVRTSTNIAAAPIRTNSIPSQAPASTNFAAKAEPVTNRVAKPVTMLPAPKSERVLTQTTAPRIIAKEPAPPAIRAEPEFKPEVVQIDEEPAPAAGRQVAEIKPAEPQTSPVTAVAQTNEDFVLPPLIRPAYRAQKPGITQKLNPLKWFRPGDSRTPRTISSVPEKNSALPTNQVALNVQPPQQAPEAARDPDPVTTRRYTFDKFEIPGAGDRSAAEAALRKGVTAQTDNQLGAAIESYQRAVRSDPTYFDAYYNLALAAYEMRNLPLALSASERAIRIKPDSANARYNFALALQDSNFPYDAEAQLEQVLSHDPKNARAHFALASLAAETLRKPALAHEHFIKLLELEPNHPNAPQIRYWLASHPQ